MVKHVLQATIKKMCGITGTLPPCDLPRSVRATLALFTLVAIIAVAASGCASSSVEIAGEPQDSTRSTGINIGDLAPDFTLADLDGNPITLSDFQGNTVFINFWATWCPPCRKEMPNIESLYQDYKDSDVIVIGVDIKESVDKVREFTQKGGYSWIFVIDDTYKVTRDYAVNAIPTSYFLDKEGIIRAVHIGYMTRAAMEANLAKALN